MDSAGGQSRDSGSGFWRGLTAWLLWVLASTIGGAVGGTAFVLEFFGVLVLFGLILGTAQASTLRRYVRRATGSWVVASFLGWLAGWLVLGLAQGTLEGLLSEITRLAGSEAAATQASQISVWTMLGVSQALVIWRWSSPFLAALWTVAGVVGGTAAQVAAFYLANAPALQPGGGQDPLYRIVSGAASQAAAGALYGAATGVVLAMIVKRLDEQRSVRVAANT